MNDAFICDAVRTPIGRYGGALASVRADDLAAIPLKALMVRNPQVNWASVDDIIYGCANQAGEDNRNVARTSTGRPASRPALRLFPRLRRHGGTCHQVRRDRFDDCRGCGEHVAGAVCHGQGRERLLAQCRHL